jgi:hypothetical protein
MHIVGLCHLTIHFYAINMQYSTTWLCIVGFAACLPAWHVVFNPDQQAVCFSPPQRERHPPLLHIPLRQESMAKSAACCLSCSAGVHVAEQRPGLLPGPQKFQRKLLRSSAAGGTLAKLVHVQDAAAIDTLCTAACCKAVCWSLLLA